jgi:hypothetical protein
MGNVSWDRPSGGSYARRPQKKFSGSGLERKSKLIFALALLAGLIVVVFAVRAKMVKNGEVVEGKRLHEARLAEWKAKGWDDNAGGSQAGAQSGNGTQR